MEVKNVSRDGLSVTDFGEIASAAQNGVARWRSLTALRVLVPIGKDLLGLFYLFLRAGEVKFHFPGSARDVNLDGRQTTALHSQVELFVGFVYSVALQTSHG
jgi:hypothetical protein